MLWPSSADLHAPSDNKPFNKKLRDPPPAPPDLSRGHQCSQRYFFSNMTRPREMPPPQSSLHSPQKTALKAFHSNLHTYLSLTSLTPQPLWSQVRSQRLSCFRGEHELLTGTVSLMTSSPQVPALNPAHQRRGCTVTQRRASKRSIYRAFMTKKATKIRSQILWSRGSASQELPTQSKSTRCTLASPLDGWRSQPGRGSSPLPTGL